MHATRAATARRVFRDHRTLVIGCTLLGGMVLFALLAPLFGSPYATPLDGLTESGQSHGVLSHGHLLGTDELGRDMLARSAAGARTSLEIAFLANITSVGLGVLVGMAAAFYRGWVEQL